MTRAGLALAALAMLSCGKAKPPAPPPAAPPAKTVPKPVPTAEDILSFSWFRPVVKPGTREFLPTYHVVLSESWKQKKGEVPRELFGHAAPGRVFAGCLPDQHMKRHHAMLKNLGLEKLKASEPGEHPAEALRKDALDSQRRTLTRLIAVGTEAGTRVYACRDQQGAEVAAIFEKCEAFIGQAAAGCTPVAAEVWPPKGK